MLLSPADDPAFLAHQQRLLWSSDEAPQPDANAMEPVLTHAGRHGLDAPQWGEERWQDRSVRRVAAGAIPADKLELAPEPPLVFSQSARSARWSQAAAIAAYDAADLPPTSPK